MKKFPPKKNLPKKSQPEPEPPKVRPLLVNGINVESLLVPGDVLTYSGHDLVLHEMAFSHIGPNGILIGFPTDDTSRLLKLSRNDYAARCLPERVSHINRMTRRKWAARRMEDMEADPPDGQYARDARTSCEVPF